MAANRKIGIDFGTTNSAVCYLDDNKYIQAISFGSAQTPTHYVPSCVAIGLCDAGQLARRGSIHRSHF